MTRDQFAAMVDMVALSPVTTWSQVESLITDACENGFHSIGCPYCYHPEAVARLKELGMYGKVFLLGGGGFPDGNWSTEAKLASVARCMEVGCNEIDLTTNVGWIKAGMWDTYRHEVIAVRNLTRGVPLKAIIHAPLLTDEEIRHACQLLMAENVDYIKTDTGRSPSASTPEHVRLIRSVVGDSMKIKASGGIRTVETVLAMKEASVDRLGISHSSAMHILNSLPNA